MKTFIFILAAGLTSMTGNSQDTLYTRSGEAIPAKVVEISPDIIKYKRSANIDGPLYVIPKDEVALIHYENGTKDVFGIAEESDEDNDSPGVVNNYYQHSPWYGTPGLNFVFGAFPFPGFSAWYYPTVRPYFRPYRYHHHHHVYSHHHHRKHYGPRGRR